MNKSGKQILAMLEDRYQKYGKQKLLLHVCCGPCSSGVLGQLQQYFDVTLYYYNPNIFPSSEYDKRKEELPKVVKGLHLDFPIVVEPYQADEFYSKIKGHELDPEGGERCHICYQLRMEKTAQYAKQHGYDIFTTTLSISPYKNSQVLNEIGYALGQQYGIEYLYSDFKKNNGYLKSCQISRELGIYRQDYCGCVYSLQERKRQIDELDRK